VTPEERSAQALDWFAGSREPLISSDWLITETHSALGIKQRHHGLSSATVAMGFFLCSEMLMAISVNTRCAMDNPAQLFGPGKHDRR
jgi:hypothetical protein